MYQPVSYKLDGRGGTREELVSLINTCRKFGARVYVDIIFNHFTGAGNDMLNHRNPSAGCTKWGKLYFFQIKNKKNSLLLFFGYNIY